MTFCTVCGTELAADARFCQKCGATATPGAVAVAAGVGAGAVAAPTAAYAGFWRRFFAFWVDKIIVGGGVQLLFIPLGVATMPLDGYGDDVNPAWMMAVIASMLTAIMFTVVADWLYEALFLGSTWQATPGKRLLSVYVTDERGERISFVRATGRHFSRIVSGLILGVGYFMQPFTERKQALHDKLAETLVMVRR